ncbi:AMP-binding protein, partial [Vibrio cholerae]
PDATEETIQDGWLCTGDLARVDEDGFVYIVGRKKEMIISGGENIYPLEVEQVINKLSDVYEVAVVGRQHVKWGEIPI